MLRIVEDRRRQRGIGSAGREDVEEVVERAGAAGAMTGMATADDTAAVISQSNPARVPSRSIDVSRISPAPRASASFAHSTASRPAGVLPLREKTGVSAVLAFRVDGDDDRLAAVAAGERASGAPVRRAARCSG